MNRTQVGRLIKRKEKNGRLGSCTSSSSLSVTYISSVLYNNTGQRGEALMRESKKIKRYQD
jgi:hypothetical protein